MKAVEEGVAELGERPELLLGVDNESIAGDDAVVVAMHDRDEPEVRGNNLTILDNFTRLKHH